MANPVKRTNERDGEFGDESVAFTLTKPVDLATLESELSEAMNWRKDAGLIADGDAALASADTPVVLWVMRSDVTPATLRSVVTKHQMPEGPSDRLAWLLEVLEDDEAHQEPDPVREAVVYLLRRAQLGL